MSELEAEIQRIDAEIEVLQRVRTRLQAKVVREPSAFAARPKWHLPAEEPAPKAQPRGERGNVGEPTPAILSVLATLRQIEPATYGELLQRCTKGESTIHKAKRWMVQAEDKRWSLSQDGLQALARNSQTNPSQSPSSDQPRDNRE